MPSESLRRPSALASSFQGDATATSASADLRADLAARLRNVCDGMPADQFDRLVDDICAVKLKWVREGRSP